VLCSPTALEETVAQVLGASSMMASTDEAAMESQLPASEPEPELTGGCQQTVGWVWMGKGQRPE
jgi:hypothetical protein